MINGIERQGRQRAARRNRHHRGQDESQAISHVLVGRAGQRWCVTWEVKKKPNPSFKIKAM